MTRIRDIARIIGKSEAQNTNNNRYITEAPFDSAKVTNIIEEQSSPIAKYDSIGALPTSGLTSGDRALVENSDSNSARFYISNGSGWYNMALVNISPSISLSPAGDITLSTGGTASTVTVTSSDSDNPDAIITYSVESDGNMVGTGTTLTQDSSVFTIDPKTTAEGGTDGDFTLTFKASDGIGFTTATKDFSLTFTRDVTFSSLTISGDDLTAAISGSYSGTHPAVNLRNLTNYVVGGFLLQFYSGELGNEGSVVGQARIQTAGSFTMVSTLSGSNVIVSWASGTNTWSALIGGSGFTAKSAKVWDRQGTTVLRSTNL